MYDKDNGHADPTCNLPRPSSPEQSLVPNLSLVGRQASVSQLLMDRTMILVMMMVLIKIMVIMMFMVVTTINIIITITTSVDDNARSTHSMNSSSAPCRLLPQVTCHPVKLVTKKLLPRQENATMVNKIINSISSTTCYLPPCFSTLGDPEICNQS